MISYNLINSESDDTGHLDYDSSAITAANYLISDFHPLKTSSLIIL